MSAGHAVAREASGLAARPATKRPGRERLAAPLGAPQPGQVNVKPEKRYPHIGLPHRVWARLSRARADLAFANWGRLVDI